MAVDPTTIIVAIIGTAGVLGSAWMNRQRHNELKHEVKAVRSTVGEQNGQGNVVEMLEFLKTWIIQHEIRHTYDVQNTRAQPDVDSVRRAFGPEQSD